MKKHKLQKKWTEKDIDFMRKNINKLTSRQIAEKLKRTKSSVSGMCHELNIYRNDEAKKRMMESGYFKKGHPSWNKGKKGVHYNLETEFKKGHIPANIKYDGCISVRNNSTKLAYKHIRISKNNWILYHHYLWKKANGPIPENHIIAFKNGNNLDCRIENLICMTMKENMERNRNYNTDNYIATCITRSCPEVKNEVMEYKQLLDLKRIQLKLRRTINDTKRET